MDSTEVRAMVQTGPRAMELRHLKRPTIGDDEALIRVEACGICGSDIEMYNMDQPGFPLIRGHEPVGTIDEIGKTMAARRNLAVGDRVAVDPHIRCGTCRYCLDGRGELCRGSGDQLSNAYSMIPLSVEPGLWGGFATHLLATSQTILYPVPAHVPPNLAALFNIFGAAIKWTTDVAEARVGSTVVVLGCGQRGIACALAAVEAGAESVVVTGLTRDRHKLDLATELGVHRAIDIENEDLRKVVLGEAGGGVDIVIDTTPGSAQSIAEAVAIVRPGGKIVAAGMKGRPADGIPIDELIMKEVTLEGVRGAGPDHYRRAISMIANTKVPLHRLQTHVLPLEEVEHGIAMLAGKVAGEHPINIVIQLS